MAEHLYPYGRPADTEWAKPYRYAYFVKRVGLRWQVWHEYEDAHSEPNGAKEWRSVWGLSFWRRLNALRIAADLQHANRMGFGMFPLDHDDPTLSPSAQEAGALTTEQGEA